MSKRYSGNAVNGATKDSTVGVPGMFVFAEMIATPPLVLTAWCWMISMGDGWIANEMYSGG